MDKTLDLSAKKMDNTPDLSALSASSSVMSTSTESSHSNDTNVDEDSVLVDIMDDEADKALKSGEVSIF